jgi:hypothetical protein
VSREALPIEFRVAGRPVGGETLALDAGDRVLVLTSCSADLGLELRTTYMANRRGEVLVGESWAIGAEEGGPLSRRVEAEEEPLLERRAACLYGHLGRLVELAREAGYELRFNGVDEAVGRLSPASV